MGGRARGRFNRGLTYRSRFSSPVLFSKYITAREDLPEGAKGTAFFSGRTCQIITAAIIRAVATKAGMKSFFRLN
jgi:hypothetical protein